MAPSTRKLTMFVTVHKDADGNPADRTFGPNDDVPKWAADQIKNPQVWEGFEDSDQAAAGGASLVSNEDPPENERYGGWKNDQLKAEIEARNKTLDPEATPMSTEGKKADLVARLVAFDAAGSAGMDTK